MRGRLVIGFRRCSHLPHSAEVLMAGSDRDFFLSGTPSLGQIVPWCSMIEHQEDAKSGMLVLIVLLLINAVDGESGFAGGLRGNLWITLLRPQIVASDQPTADVAEGDYRVGVLGRQCVIHRTSNLEPLGTLLLNGGIRCVRSSHLRPRCSDVRRRNPQWCGRDGSLWQRRLPWSLNSAKPDTVLPAVLSATARNWQNYQVTTGAFVVSSAGPKIT